jgi:hypothetical protein
MKSGDSGNETLIKWAALAVPGLTAGLTWPATEGRVWVERIAIGVAIALAVYAVIHLAVRVSRRRGGR